MASSFISARWATGGMMTQVLDLATGRILVFTLPPIHAVIAAYEQAHGNGNTWTYQLSHPLLEFGPSGNTVFCDRFGTLIHQG